MTEPKSQSEFKGIFVPGHEIKKTYTLLVNDTEEVLAVCTFKAISGASKANPGVITSTGHGLSSGNKVFIHSVAGMVELNERWFYAKVLTANTFSLYRTYKNGKFADGVNSTGYTTYTSGGFVIKSFPIMGLLWYGDTGNNYPAQIAYPGSTAPTADSPPPGLVLSADIDDLAKVMAIGKAGEVIHYRYFIPD